MGLGKTIEVIARLIQERNNEVEVAPTLLIVPTSVIGNWQKEITKFCPPISRAWFIMAVTDTKVRQNLKKRSPLTM